jgi:hypothetical protein
VEPVEVVAIPLDLEAGQVVGHVGDLDPGSPSREAKLGDDERTGRSCSWGVPLQSWVLAFY